MSLASIHTRIVNDPENAWAREKGWSPVYTAGEEAKILIVGQAPGIRAQESGIPWNDASGDNLRSWMCVSRETFYDTRKIALVPMDFFFPGAGAHGDMPPRPGFAEQWHPLLRSAMPHIELTLLVGIHAQRYYLGARRKRTLSETVRAYAEYLPASMPLVHPSPRNNIWQKRNPWFKAEVLPTLCERVNEVLGSVPRETSFP